jgi:hypothetical protein
MAYATVNDIQARMPQFELSSSTKPSLASADAFRGDVEADLESLLSNLGYVVPITGTRSTSMVKVLVCYGSIARILMARATAVGTEAAFKSADRAQAYYDQQILRLSDPKNPLELDDAERTDNAAEKLSLNLGVLMTDDDGNSIEPRATMTMKF